MSTAALEQVIINSLLAKKHFIEIDEFDRGERLLLNLGHTFGHAIEGASHFAIPHGIGVGIRNSLCPRFPTQTWYRLCKRPPRPPV